MTAMILLVSNTQDLTCDFVVRELTNRRMPFARLNTDEYPLHGRGTVEIDGKWQRRLIQWDNRERPLDFDSVRAVWFRRPVKPVVDSQVTDAAVREFAINESYDFLRGLWYSLNCYWMSSPEAIRRAEHKVFQFGLAAQLGLPLPKTVVSNDPKEIMNFVQRCPGEVIVKPLYIGFIDDPREPRFIYTTQLRDSDLRAIETARFAPSVYQEKVEKEFDVRVTVVGERLFAAKIEAPGLPPGIPDWRAAPVDELLHSCHELPLEIQEQCVGLVKELNLDFGAIDLAYSERTGYSFLEINANGQWAWLETELGFPIARAIADRLVEGASGFRP